MELNNPSPTVSKPFSKEVIRELKKLEKKRKLAANRSWFWSITPMICSLPFFIGFITKMEWLYTFGIGWSFFLVIGTIMFLILLLPNKADISKSYKKIVLPEILKNIGVVGKYQTSHLLSVQDILKSGLYRENYSHIERYDNVIGSFKNIPFGLYELAIQIATIHSSDAGGTYKTYTNHFYGWVLHVPVTMIYGKTYVIPRKRKTLHESDDWITAVSQYVQTKSDSRLVNFMDPIFDSRFFVFSTNSNEAEWLLNSPIRDFLNQVYDVSENTPAFSFFEKRVYMHIGIVHSDLDLKKGQTVYPENSEFQIKQLRYFCAIATALHTATLN